MSELAERGSNTIKVLDDEEIAGLKVACKVRLVTKMKRIIRSKWSFINFLKLAREVLDEAAKAVAVGVTTDEIDRIVHEAAIERECYPSPLNYYQ